MIAVTDARLHFNDNDRIEKVAGWYRRIGGSYSRAWDIVAGEKLHLDFIEELSDSSQWQVNRAQQTLDLSKGL